MDGFYRVASAQIKTTIANPEANAKEIIALLEGSNRRDVGVILFPELTLTSYSAYDLFFSRSLLIAQDRAIISILERSQDISTVAIIGAVVNYRGRFFNSALIIQRGEILGAVPKIYIPNRREFYEKRYFSSGRDIGGYVNIAGREVPFGTDLLFRDSKELIFGVEICEDLWAINPPSFKMASAGANLIFNLSSSNELIGKAQYREELVRTQSARCISGYVYASSGVYETTTDTIFGGDLIISEYGKTLKRGKRFELDSSYIYADIDLEKLNYLRLGETSFSDEPIADFRDIEIANLPRVQNIEVNISRLPFVPPIKYRDEVCEEITNIQSYSLIRRMEGAGVKKAVIGVSGGLDSTLALLSTHRAFKIRNWNTKDIIAISMGGFGTTTETKNSAKELCEILGVTFRELDIRYISLREFELIGHKPEDLSVTYENVQARARTSILFNTANREGGLVIGTGDLSEIALGWSTYNGDHMSSYALNSGIPKTLIKYIIEFYKGDNKISKIIDDILKRPISPELLPHQNDKIVQKTEDIIGPYELHDFFLYHFIKYGATPKKILFLAEIAFRDIYSRETVKKWLKLFIKRFFTQQFKRSCMPDGPKVGTISLSPRADWRMASDSDFEVWLDF
ncbi:MAG: NAD(+) synthase [Epsilonproteobacteria bacterium]|nr:NAD(+) synthase [Campylobacterota bacterium]